jgi:tetratricopeptide (TPR) repeat protein
LNNRFESAAIFKFALIMAMLVILCSFAQAQENTSDYWCQKGQSLMADGLEYRNGASEAFDKAIQIDPNNIDAWLGKAEHSGTYCNGENESIEAFHRVLNLTDEYLGMNPGDAKAWQSRGLALAYLGMEDEASKAFEKSLEILNVSLNEDPKDAEAWWLKAEDLELLGRSDIALEAYDKIIDLNSSKVLEAWLRKSDIFSGQPGGYNQSEEAFSNAIDQIFTDLSIADSGSKKNFSSSQFTSFWHDESGNIIIQSI